MNKRSKKKIPPASRRSKPGIGKRVADIISLVEHLPYVASLLREKKAARVIMGTGILVMAIGAAIFSIGWKWHITWLVETAFVITLIGWMMVILGFAFGVVGLLAKFIPMKPGKFKLHP